MIQRIQTVYLFLASAALALLFLFPIYTFDKKNDEGQTIASKIYVTGTHEKIGDDFVLTSKSQFPMVMTVMIGIALMISIFLYESRKEQLNFARVLVVLEFLLMVVIFYNISVEVSVAGTSNVNYAIGAFLPSIAILFTILASRAIRKDEELVKAADRLR